MYAWDEGTGGQWSEPYGFVPLVQIQHNNIGLVWGESEIHAGRSKFQEADDQASKLSDYIRKVVASPMLLTGVYEDEDGAALKVEYSEASSAAPEPLREEVPFLYGQIGADAKPLVVPLDIAQTAAYIKDLLGELERDYPELQMDIWNASGDVSGRALRAARARVIDKVQQRRPVYDDALRRAQQMAVAIGGWRGYAGYETFNLDSYARGLLDHQIGERPVFNPDPEDAATVDKLFWEGAELAVRSGASLEGYLRAKGWDDEQVKTIISGTIFPEPGYVGCAPTRTPHAVGASRRSGSPLTTATRSGCTMTRKAVCRRQTC